jgi:hypothetical protein
VIYSYNETIFHVIKQVNTSLAIIITDEKLLNTSVPTFTIPKLNAIGLLNDTDTSESLTLNYWYDCNKYTDRCNEYWPITVMYTISLLIWTGIIGLWVYNNHKLNYNHAELFHKFSTILLVFKLLNASACLLECLYCPPTRMTFEVISLFKKQTRSLYETSFFAYLLLLSKGWSLVINSMGRKEFNYLVILVIFVYIFDSASNIIEIGMDPIKILLYMLVIIHSLGYGFYTLKLLSVQIEAIRETGMSILFPVIQKKKKLFTGFLLLLISYFVFEYIIHFFIFNQIISFDTTWQKKIALLTIVHEFVEIWTVGGIFYLYRAREMGRFFSIDFDESPNLRRSMPFYESKKDCEQGPIAVIILPQKRIMLGK